MNPERNRETNEIQEINQPKQEEITESEKEEIQHDLEANPPTLDHEGELKQVEGGPETENQNGDITIGTDELSSVEGTSELKNEIAKDQPEQKESKLDYLEEVAGRIIEANPVSNGLYVLAKETINNVQAALEKIDMRDDPATIIERNEAITETRSNEMDKSCTDALEKFKADPVYGGVYVLAKETVNNVQVALEKIDMRDDPATIIERNEAITETRSNEMDKSCTDALEKFKADPVYGGVYVLAKETVNNVQVALEKIDMRDDPATIIERNEAITETRSNEMDKSCTDALEKIKADPVYGGVYVLAKETVNNVQVALEKIDMRDDPATIIERNEAITETRSNEMETAVDEWLYRDINQI